MEEFEWEHIFDLVTEKALVLAMMQKDTVLSELG